MTFSKPCVPSVPFQPYKGWELDLTAMGTQAAGTESGTHRELNHRRERDRNRTSERLSSGNPKVQFRGTGTELTDGKSRKNAVSAGTERELSEASSVAAAPTPSSLPSTCHRAVGTTIEALRSKLKTPNGSSSRWVNGPHRRAMARSFRTVSYPCPSEVTP